MLDLGTRMKTYYESTPQTKLMRRTPVAIRIDGKAFHTFTKGFAVPFDHVLIKSMQETMRYLCKSIQGCVLGYCQSDEITLILTDYATFNTNAWFDYEVQKLCSVSASMATMAFNFFLEENAKKVLSKDEYESSPYWSKNLVGEAHTGFKLACFDSRCFNIPKEEVANLIYWRQLDASRNSVQMVGRSVFSHKEMQGLSNSQVQDKLMKEHGINWNDFDTYLKRGSCCIKQNDEWVIDKDIPIFSGENRMYIERYI